MEIDKNVKKYDISLFKLERRLNRDLNLTR